MNACFITFRSVTHAQRGQRQLMEAGVSCVMQRTPRWMEEKGCGYSLRISAGDCSKAAQLLRQKGVPMRRIYTQLNDGTLEELVL